MFNHLCTSNPNADPRVSFAYLVGGRSVCSAVFQEHWCISKATLERCVALIRMGIRNVEEYTAAGKGEGRDSKKAMFIVAWVKQYASEVTEKLPDATQVLLPRQAWTSMHEEFQNDMKAAGCETSAQIASFTYFRDVFKTSPELSGIEMTRFKGNFNKCAKCISLTGRVMNALKAHDAAAHADAKVERLEHYMEARAGKVHYYGQRAASRSACAVKLTLIVDKMDSAKNHIPWFSNGRKPKDVDALLSDVLKLHITGVIIHGRPDARYIFYSYPHLPGNANLNIECVRRALLHYLRDKPFRPKLYFQFDNASDNINYAILCLLGELVRDGYIAQAELCMMLVGHTHEDIDAMFRFIADALRKQGLVRTIDEFVAATKNTFRDQSIHVEHVAAVHDVTAWLKPHHATFEKFKGKRYIVIAKRESDGLPVLWYKPSPSHAHLYPSKKDPVTGMPLFHLAADGEKVYETCMEGIEIFEVGFVPSGTPPIQPLFSDRLDPAAVYNTTKQIMDAHPELFEEVQSWWAAWKDAVPRTAAEAVAAHPMKWEWPSKSENWAPARFEGLRQEYAETMTYVNQVANTSHTAQAAAQTVQEEKPSPAIPAGCLVITQSPAGDAWGLPFWLGETCTAVSESAKEFDVEWYACFKGGYNCTDVTKSWRKICCGAGARPDGSARYHPYDNKCRAGGRPSNGHGPMRAKISRDTVALYDAKLTDGHQILCGLPCLEPIIDTHSHISPSPPLCARQEQSFAYRAGKAPPCAKSQRWHSEVLGSAATERPFESRS